MSQIPMPNEMFADLTVKRFTAGAWTNGIWTPPSPSTITVRGSVQPAPQEELLNLPEAQRTKDVVKIYSTDELRTANESNGTPADRVVVGTEYYEVQRVTYHREDVLTHYKVIAVRLDRS